MCISLIACFAGLDEALLVLERRRMHELRKGNDPLLTTFSSTSAASVSWTPTSRD
jgi:hypothetical protein